ncbi:MAG: PQQ-binding-like beta-propeller repeat protein [Bacteroidota bacterium]
MGRTSTDAEALDGATGKQIWKLNFKNDLKIKELKRASYNNGKGGAGIVCFNNRDEKKKNGEKVIIDFSTGKELWRTESYPGLDNDSQWHFGAMIATVTSGSTFIVFDDENKKFVGLDIRSGAKKWESKPYPTTDISKVSINAVGDSEFSQILIYGEDEETYDILYMNIVTGELLKDDSRFTMLLETIANLPMVLSRLSKRQKKLSSRLPGE